MAKIKYDFNVFLFIYITVPTSGDGEFNDSFKADSNILSEATFQSCFYWIAVS